MCAASVKKCAPPKLSLFTIPMSTKWFSKTAKISWSNGARARKTRLRKDQKRRSGFVTCRMDERTRFKKPNQKAPSHDRSDYLFCSGGHGHHSSAHGCDLKERFSRGAQPNYLFKRCCGSLCDVGRRFLVCGAAFGLR